MLSAIDNDSPKKTSRRGKNSIIMSDMDEDYGFEYSDEEQDEEQVDVENQYYNAKGGRSLLFVIERRRY